MLNKKQVGWKAMKVEKYTRQRNIDYIGGVVLVITMFILIVLFSLI